MPFLLAVAAGESIAVPLVCAFFPILVLLPVALAGLALRGRRGYVSMAGPAVAAFCFAAAAGLAAAILAVFVATGRSDVAFLQALVRIAGLVCWTCLVVGLVTGLQGARQWQRGHFHGERLRGRGLSLFSAAGSALLGLAAIGSVYQFGDKIDRAPAAVAAAPAPAGATALRPATSAASPSLSGFAGRATVDPPEKNWLGRVIDTPRSAPGDGPAVLEFQTLNVRFRRPGDGWSRIDATTANASSLLAYQQEASGLRFILIAERMGVETPFTAADLLETARAYQSERLKDVRFDAPVERSIAGIAGLRSGSTFQSGLQRGAIQLWTTVNNGFAYQMFVMGEADARNRLLDEALRMFSNFELIDPAAIAHAPGFAAPAGRRTLRPYGCTIDLSETPWRAWNEHAGEIAAAEYGARVDPATRFFVVPALLTVAPRDAESAARGLFSAAGIAFAQVSQGDRRSVKQSNLSGEEWQWRGSSLDGETQNVARVFVAPHCAFLLCGACPIDRADRIELIRRALDGVTFETKPPPADSKGEKRYRANSGLFYNELGLSHYHREQWDDAHRYLRAALERVPDEPTYVENTADVCQRLGRPAEALVVLESAAKGIAEKPDIRLRRANLLVETERVDEACREYAAVFAAGHRDEADLRRYVELLDDAGRHDASRAVLADYRRAGDSSAATVLAAASLRRGGKAEEAVTLLERRVAELPHDEDLAYELIVTYRKLERYREALAIADKRLAAGKDELSALYWKGLLELDLELFRPAKLTLEKARRLDPDNRAVQVLLEHAAAALGEGENVRIKTPIEPVSPPQAVTAALPAGPLSAEFQAASAYYADRTTVYKFVPGEEWTRTESYYVVVQNEQGVTEFNTLSLQFDPLAEQIYVNRLEVFDRDGARLAAGETSDYFVLDDSTQSMAVHDKILEMPVPGLRPGCRIELVVTIRKLSPPKHFPYVDRVFGMSYPCRREAVVVLGDEKHLSFAGSLAADVRRDAGCVWWQAVDRPAYRSEPLSPEIAESEPSIFVADRRATWADETEEYLEEIADRLTVSAEVRRAAEEQVRGLADREAKIAALTDFVRRTISYKAVEFGRRARIMHPADQTLTDRYGDCKDMSLLLAQLLTSVGVEALPALVHSSRPLQEATASFDQFDHMIVYLPDADDPRAVDPTDRHGNPQLPVPLSLAGKKLYVVDGKQSRVVTLPPLESESYRADVERRVRYRDDGTAEVSESITFAGYYASGMRGFFAMFAEDQRRDRWQSYLESGGVAPTVRKFAIENLDRRDQPLVIKTEFEVERSLLPAAALRVGTIPAPLESMTCSPEILERRRLPVEIRYPLRIRTRTIIEPPQQCDLPDAKLLTGDLNGNRLSCRSTAEIAEGKLVLSVDLQRKAGRGPPESYEEYCRAAREVRRAVAPAVAFPTK